jgi:glycosyltransferase involved in cell wall biosynthesis
MNKKEKKIYIINQYYHPFFAATGQLLKELSESLNENNYKIEVITGTNGEKNLKKQENINGVVVNRLKNKKDGIKYKTKLLSYITFYWHLFWFLIFKTEKNSLIFSLSTPPLISYIPILLKKIKKFHIIYNIQDLYPDILDRIDKNNKNKFYYKFSKKISQKIIDKSEKVIVIGECMANALKKSYQIEENKIKIIENWALKEIEEYQEKENNENNENNENLKVLYSGNFGRGHEHKTILKCIEKIKEEKMKNIEFIFVGGGYNYNKLKEKTNNYSFIKFKPFVEREKLPEVLSNSDICLAIGSKELEGIIVPSKFYGIVASKKPIIYINSGNDTIAKHIQKGNLGFNIDNFDSDKLFEKLKYLTENKELISKLRTNVETYYNKNLKREISLKKYTKLFKELEEK